jgi:ketosteroid isomerase-like protein
MQANKELIANFYTSFAKGDAEGMLSCYHPNLTFRDPAFGDLNAEDACSMWKMLLARGSNPEITFHGEWADEKKGGVNWEAKYEFGPQKRKVHNKITAKFQFQDGLIIDHDDYFDFWKWSRMALGTPGVLLGWSPVIKNKVRKTVLKLLSDFKAKQ